jgi:hypothetical protein
VGWLKISLQNLFNLHSNIIIEIFAYLNLLSARKQVTEAITTGVPASVSGSTDFALMSSTQESCAVPDKTDAVLTIGKS